MSQYIEQIVLSSNTYWATKGLSGYKAGTEKEIGLILSPLFNEEKMEALFSQNLNPSGIILTKE